MKKFAVKRFVQMLITLLLVTFLSFSIIYFAPGDPLYMYMTPTSGSFKMSEEQLESMRHKMGLDGNMAEQYIRWGKRMLKGNWGVSLSNYQPVKKQVLDRLPNTIGIMGAAMVLALVLSVPLGLLAGYYKNRWVDNLVNCVSYFGISIPVFWFGMLLIIIFSMKLGILPSSGMHTLGETGFLDLLRHSVLPVIVLSVNHLAVFTRYIRSNTIQQLEEEYVLTALSKGASKKRVLFVHVMKNCLLPVVTLAGMNFGTLITGSFVVETVFGWPGLGMLCMEGINNRDYPIIMAITMLSCTVLLIGNFLADVLYGMIDPRIRQGER